MVRKEGRENGVGIWEIDGYKSLESGIKECVDGFEPQFYIDEICVFGSYGAGYGVPGESDLDIIVFGVFNGVLSSDELSVLQDELSRHILESGVFEGFDVFSDFDVYIDDPARKDEAFSVYSAFEPVEMYYNLTEDRTEEY